MNCQECRAELLELGETETATSHVERCADCQAALASLEESRIWLKTDATFAEPSEALRSRVLGEVTETAARRPGRLSARWISAGVAAALALVVIGAAVLRDPPDWEIGLVGTENAPLASASIAGWNEGTSTRLRLDPAGLPLAPEGSFYELWFSGPDGLISAGTFTAPDETNLIVGVRRGAFPRIWVTLEQLDADPLPSGTTLLITEG